jgi:N-acetylmuramoyl-L-alanine amidase
MTAAPPQRAPELRYVVVLDPAHGGPDPGALLANTDEEKTFTLALALQLRALLNARGIRTVLTRDADGAVDTTARATTANRSHASACLLLHATSTGFGVHLFTSSIPSAGPQRAHNRQRTFLPWRTAQASYATESLRLESDIHAAFAQAHVPALLGQTSLSPLDNLACPAVAVEVAPLDGQTAVTDPAYRRRVVQALAVALTQWRSDWRLQP